MRIALFGTALFSISFVATRAFAINATLIATTDNGYSALDPQPAINSNGDVAFRGMGSSGQDGVYFYSSNSNAVWRQDFGQVKADRHDVVRMNSQGAVVEVGNGTTGDGIYTKTASSSGGGALLTIQGNNFSQYTDPAVLDNGSIVFSALDSNDSNQRGIYAADSSGQIITIAGGSSLSIKPTGTLSLNGSGSYVMAGLDPNTGSLGVYSGSVSGGSLITLHGANFSSAGTLSVSSSRSGARVAWSGTLTVGGSSKSQLFIGNIGGGPITTITGQNFSTCSIDSSGEVLIDGTDPSTGERSLLDYSANGVSHGSYLSIGDALDGSTVSDFSISPDALNDSGQFVFQATLADGRSEIYTAALLPEPTTIIAPLAGGILMIARRRRCNGR